MFLPSLDIQPSSIVSDIVTRDHRTSDVFRKYNIEYCCGGKFPLSTICMMKGLDFEDLRDELIRATRQLHLPGFLPYEEWGINFLTDYIVHVHHFYLKRVIPEWWAVLSHFVEEHGKKFPHLFEIQKAYKRILDELLPELEQEEQVVFPYIRQLNNAYHNREAYAVLLVKTLRKPFVTMMASEHQLIQQVLGQFREFSNEYQLPEKCCTSHRMIFAKLREIDHDLSQHVYLEREVLFPKTMAMETELLEPGYQAV